MSCIGDYEIDGGHGVTKGIPEGWHTVTPRLVVHDPAAFVTFLKQAFGATGNLQPDGPAQVTIGDSIVMISGVGVREATPSLLHLYVDDADATYRRALEAGAESLEAPHIVPYGDLRAMVKDPAGNTWQIATYNGSPS